jgi:hypothetical protein
MRSTPSRVALALVLGCALIAAGCSSQAAPASQPVAVKKPVYEGQTYVASPEKHFKMLSEERKRQIDDAKAQARARAGATVTPCSQPAAPARTFPEPTVNAAPAAAPCAAPCQPACDPCCDPCCPGGKCGIPPPAFCCDPSCCPGGKCGIPPPAFPCCPK